jgi:septal ring factor EnvC (AmiA/AmiB activator)
VFFDTTFVNFFKDNYSRIVRAIDREPGLEIPILNGFQKGISRDLVDSLRGQVAEHAQEIQTLETRLAQEQAEHRKHSEEAAAELNKLRTSMEGLQRAHEAESRKRKDEANNELRELKMKMDGLRGSHDAALRKQREEAAAEVQQLKNALQGLERAHDAETRYVFQYDGPKDSHFLMVIIGSCRVSMPSRFPSMRNSLLKFASL